MEVATCRVGFSLAILLATCLGCREEPEPPAQVAGQPRAAETESPNARILPEPLPDAGPQAATEGDADFSASDEAQPERKPRQALPVVGPLSPERATLGVVSGIVLLGTFAWPPARGVVGGEAEAEPAWPTMRVELTPQFRDEPGRARLVLTSDVWGLPRETELRARSDRHGFIVVWPDDRSYRVVPQGALRALFEERRVDNMPLVPLELSELGVGKRLGRATRKIRAQGPVGALRLDLVEVPESGLESGLLCDFFFGLIRAQTPKGLCEGGELPVFVDVESPGEASLQFSVSEMSIQADLRKAQFLVPPELSIYKPGELPPAGANLWEPEVLIQIVPVAADGPELRFFNHHDVPLFLILDSVPVSRIEPRQELSWRAGKEEHRYAARDFLGQVMEAGGLVRAPAEVHLGKPEVPDEEP